MDPNSKQQTANSNKNYVIKLVASLSFFLATSQALPYDLKHELKKLAHGHGFFQLGGYWSIQGQSQQININGLIGDYFNVTDSNGSNGLVGVGYFIDGPNIKQIPIEYGINWFYLAKTSVNGTVLQENLYTNLAYSYNVTHYPLYFVAKSTFKTKLPNKAVTFDVGIGPNFMTTSNFQESSLGANTIPDAIFSGKTTTTFSATAGLGIKFNQFFGQAPLECGYRFFYLGQGNFNPLTDQTQNNLNTGSDFGNAVMCSITV